MAAPVATAVLVSRDYYQEVWRVILDAGQQVSAVVSLHGVKPDEIWPNTGTPIYVNPATVSATNVTFENASQSSATALFKVKVTHSFWHSRYNYTPSEVVLYWYGSGPISPP